MSTYKPDMEYYEDIAFQEFLLTSRRKQFCNPEKIMDAISLKNAKNIVDFGMGLGYFIPFLQQKMESEAWLWGVECQAELIDICIKNES